MIIINKLKVNIVIEKMLCPLASTSHIIFYEEKKNTSKQFAIVLKNICLHFLVGSLINNCAKYQHHKINKLGKISKSHFYKFQGLKVFNLEQNVFRIDRTLPPFTYYTRIFISRDIHIPPSLITFTLPLKRSPQISAFLFLYYNQISLTLKPYLPFS